MQRQSAEASWGTFKMRAVLAARGRAREDEEEVDTVEKRSRCCGGVRMGHTVTLTDLRCTHSDGSSGASRDSTVEGFVNKGLCSTSESSKTPKSNPVGLKP